MRLWVDDLRAPPGEGWVWEKTAGGAIRRLAAEDVKEMSLDHDLGGEMTTRPVVLFLCMNPDRWPPVIRVHSSNPPGRSWLLGMIYRYNPHLTG